MNSTIRQSDILAYLHLRQSNNLPMPTRREIGKRVGISSPSAVSYNLRRLEAVGCLKLVPGARGIVVPTDEPELRLRVTELEVENKGLRARLRQFEDVV